MVLSLRKACECIGLSGEISVMNHFFGYPRGKVKNISLRKQLQVLRDGTYVNLNIIKVGVDLYLTTDDDEVEVALSLVRNIYAQVDVGLGRIEYYELTAAQAPGRSYIDDDCEAADLTNEWTVHNNGLDVFIVPAYAGSTIGYSATDGDCNKDYDPGNTLTGSVVAVQDSGDITGSVTAQVIAHEVGHYLGLEHYVGLQDDAGGWILPPDPTRLMWPSTNSTGSNTKMTSEEGNIMRTHCFALIC